MDQVWKSKYLNIHFHHRTLGGENKFKFIFTHVYWGEQINLDLFFTPQ